jgi:glucosyl-3-phosphoglycerate phosphatase
VADFLELCFFRHGRTIWNAAGKYQGQTDVDLDALGRAQAVKVGERVAEIDPVAVYSSDLRRCVDTGAHISQTDGIQLDKRLRERDVGEWSGHTRSEIQALYPDDYNCWVKGQEVRPGGGETSAELLVRVRSFLDGVQERHSTGSVVVISHGGWIKLAAQWILTGRIERVGLGVVSQASLTTFSCHDGSWRVEAYNDRGHLLGLEPIDQDPPASSVY